MSNDVPTKPGYYRDFEGDIWRLEEEGFNNWTLRPGQPTEKRNTGVFWRYQPMYEIPTPAGSISSVGVSPQQKGARQ